MRSPLLSESRPASAGRTRRFAISTSLLLLVFAALTSAQAQNLTSFGAPAVGSPVTQAVPVPVSVSGTVASVALLTAGSPKLDFTEAAAGDTCAGNAFTAPTSCTVNVTFSPLFAGQRNGAVVLEDASGATLGVEYLTGTGQGSLAVMIPGAISIVAGQVGEWTQVNDGKLATQADLYLPSGVAVDGAGDIFIADSSHNRVREVVASTGNITTVAGNGSAGYDPTATVATSTTLTFPGGVALDGAGNLYIADTDNNVIREVNLTTGAIQTVAGNGTGGFSGDTGAATSAELNSPEGVAVDAAGNLYIADTGNNVIREVNASTGVIDTIAGGGATPGTCSGSTDSIGDGCAATSATLNAPYGVAFDPAGNLYIPDSSNNRIRRIDTSQVISTYAGDGAAGYTGDGSAATSAELYSPLGVACDAAGNLYIADARNYVVRKVSAGTLTISTVAGNNNSNIYNDGKSGYTYGNGQNGDKYTGGGIAWAGVSPKIIGAGIYAPYGLAVDAAGNIYIAEYFDNLVRKVTANASTLFFTPAEWVGQVSTAQNQTIEDDGNAVLSFSAISSDANSTLGSSGTCATSGTVAVDGRCTVQVEYSPTASGNPLVADVSLSTDLNSSLTIAAVGQALAQNTPVVTVTSTPNPSNYNQTVNFTVAVAKSPTSSQIPTGSVTLYDYFPATTPPPTVPNPPSPPPGTVIGTGTLGANSTAVIPISSLAVGSHDIYASYGGNTYYVAANSSAALVQQVNEQVTVTVTNASASNNPSTYGAPVTFIANVSITGNVPTTGTSVSFYDGATLLGTAPLDSNNNATYIASNLTPGNHNITATYTDSNGVPGSSAAYPQSVKQTTATVVTSNAAGNQSTYGNSVTLTATVTATGIVAPTGTVTFYDGATPLGTQNVTAGSGTTVTATYTTSSLAVGAHTITATYNGDAKDFTSTSAAYTLTVNATTTTTSLTASANPALAGTSVTFTAKVTSSGGNVPTGTVNFYNGTTLLKSSTLNAAGVAAWTTSSLAVGAYSLTASYQGDTNNGSSTSPALNFSVILATTSAKLTASATTVPVTAQVTFTATVTGNGVAPTGSVVFMDGTATLGTVALNGSGVASYSTSALSLGQQNITAVYQGDPDNAGSTSNVIAVTVGTFSTQTTLAASANTVASNQPVALLATVISASGKPVAGGTVNFFNGATNIGTANIGANGSASISITLTAGSDSITAQYSGDTDDAASTSDAVVISVGQATDFTIQLNPSSLTIPTGNYANLKISLASLDGFADNVALGCSSLPPSVTCNFSSTATNLAANAKTSVTLTVDTNSPLVSGSQARNHVPPVPASGGATILAAFLLPGAGLLTFWRFRRRASVLKLIAILAVVAGATLAMNGCGGLSLSSAKPGTYVIQVTATGTKTNVTHVADLTVQVTQ